MQQLYSFSFTFSIYPIPPTGTHSQTGLVLPSCVSFLCAYWLLNGVFHDISHTHTHTYTHTHTHTHYFNQIKPLYYLLFLFYPSIQQLSVHFIMLSSCTDAMLLIGFTLYHSPFLSHFLLDPPDRPPIIIIMLSLSLFLYLWTCVYV
jgi:hypothetical protein